MVNIIGVNIKETIETDGACMVYQEIHDFRK